MAIAPDGSLNILPVSELKDRLTHGYRPYTFGELRDELRSLIATNTSLAAELQKSKSSTASQSVTAPIPQGPTQAELMQAEAQRRKEMQRASDDHVSAWAASADRKRQCVRQKQDSVPLLECAPTGKKRIICLGSCKADVGWTLNARAVLLVTS